MPDLGNPYLISLPPLPNWIPCSCKPILYFQKKLTFVAIIAGFEKNFGIHSIDQHHTAIYRLLQLVDIPEIHCQKRNKAANYFRITQNRTQASGLFKIRQQVEIEMGTRP